MIDPNDVISNDNTSIITTIWSDEQQFDVMIDSFNLNKLPLK